MVLLGHIKLPAAAWGMGQAKAVYQKTYLSLKELFLYIKEVITRNVDQFYVVKC